MTPDPITTEEKKTAMSYMHETAACKRYADKGIADMLTAISTPLPRLDHTYGMKAARGELFGLPPAARTVRDQELGRDIADKFTKPKTTYDLGSSSRSTASYSGLVGKSTSTGYSGLAGTSYSGTNSSASGTTIFYGQSSGGSSYMGNGGTSQYIGGSKSCYMQ